MPKAFRFAVCFLLLVYDPSKTWADEPTCVIPVGGEPIGAVNEIHDAPGGLLIAAADGRPFRYDGVSITQIGGEDEGPWLPGYGLLFHDVPGGLLLAGEEAVLLYDGRRVIQVPGESTGTEICAFAIFRRHRYVLVPIEARRFPEAPFDEKGGSAWVVACVLSILSEGGLSFEDRGLLRAMLRRGTLAIAIDGLNEVARGQAVAAFPAAPMFVTSQEPGEPPFEVWHLPGTIAEHVDGLLALYLGEERGEALARRLRDSGLIQHLRSGYDVRLVINLAESDPEGTKLPRDRIGLYRAAVAAAWPEGDNRLELLQAAAWKLMSERGPNEDKRRLKPDEDAPKDLLEQLEAVRERSGCSIRCRSKALSRSTSSKSSRRKWLPSNHTSAFRSRAATTASSLRSCSAAISRMETPSAADLRMRSSAVMAAILAGK